MDQIGNDIRQSLQALNRTLDSANQLVKRLDMDIVPTARTTMEDVRKTLKAAERSIGSDAPIQQDLRETLRELNRTAQSLRTLTNYLERHPESLLRGRKGNEK